MSGEVEGNEIGAFGALYHRLYDRSAALRFSTWSKYSVNCVFLIGTTVQYQALPRSDLTNIQVNAVLNDESREPTWRKGQGRQNFLSFFVLFAFLPFCLFAPTSYIIHWIIKEGVSNHQRAL